ncbi:hypothetical protein Gotur_034607 [Gossypium turneri]
MESTSQDMNTTNQPGHKPSFSALIDAIALQEQCFEQSLASQQLWAKQLADEQEAKIKATVQKITVDAAEVDEILKGKNIVTSDAKPEGFNSKSEERELQSQPTCGQFSTSRSRSTSLVRYPEPDVFKEKRRYSPRDHVNKRDLGYFNSDIRYNLYKDQRRPNSQSFKYQPGDSRGRAYRRASRSPEADTNPHYGRSIDSRKHRERRGASPLEKSWKRERSPSKSTSQRYCHEDSNSGRSGSFRCQSGDDTGRNYHTVYQRPTDVGIPHDSRFIDSRKHRERSGSSHMERNWKTERRSPSKPKHQSYFDKDSHSFRCQPGDNRTKCYDSNPHHGRSIDSKKHREKRGASPLEIGRSHKSRHLSAEDRKDGYRDNGDEKISEPTGGRSGCQSKPTVDENWGKTLY